MVPKGLARLLRQLDESGLAKLIVEIVLFSAVESTLEGENDVLLATAKRHRVDMAKVRSAVVSEFAAKATNAASKETKAAPVRAAKTTAAA